MLAAVAGLLVLAVIAGLLALEQRGTARDEATAADAQRLGSRALAENDLDRSLLLARQGVALDDSPQTRGSLLAALNKSPAAIGVMRGVGERMYGAGAEPGRAHAGRRRRRRQRLPVRHAHAATRAGRPTCTPGDWAIVKLAYSPDGRRLAIAHDSHDGDVVTVMDTRTGRVGPRAGRSTTTRGRSPGCSFQGDAALDVASRPAGIEALPRPLVERFDVGSGRRILGPLTLGRRQSSPLLGTSDGRRVLTASDEQLVWPRRDDAEAGRAGRRRRCTRAA